MDRNSHQNKSSKRRAKKNGRNKQDIHPTPIPHAIQWSTINYEKYVIKYFLSIARNSNISKPCNNYVYHEL